MKSSPENRPSDLLPRKVFTRPDWFLAFGGGSGLVPGVPGTAGSVVGLVLFYPLASLGPLIHGLAVVVIIVAGIRICDRVSKQLGIDDPGGIVLDEIGGMGIALFLVPAGWYWPVAALVLFRIFDIAKPWPVGWLDKNLAGGRGIMLDDVAAGFYTLIILQIVHLFAGMVG